MLKKLIHMSDSFQSNRSDRLNLAHQSAQRRRESQRKRTAKVTLSFLCGPLRLRGLCVF